MQKEVEDTIVVGQVEGPIFQYGKNGSVQERFFRVKAEGVNEEEWQDLPCSSDGNVSLKPGERIIITSRKTIVGFRKEGNVESI